MALAVSFKSRLKANACLFVFKQRNLPDFTSKGSWQAGRTGKSFFSASQRGPSLVNDLKICFCTPLAAGKSVSWIFFPLFFAAFLMITAHKAQPSVIPAQGSSLGWCSGPCGVTKTPFKKQILWLGEHRFAAGWTHALLVLWHRCIHVILVLVNLFL